MTISANVVCNATPSSCTYTYPWYATVDSSGLSRGIYGPVAQVCNGQPVPAGQVVADNYFIPANGSVPNSYSLSDGNGNFVCGLPAQYSSSPSLTMSGTANACPPYSATPSAGVTCTYSVQQWTTSGSGVPAVFPMTVTSNIGPTVSNASATIQYRPQDLGQTGNVYVFALAPATQVKTVGSAKAMQVGVARSASKTDTPIACVLAQLNASGQLQGTTSASLQAALSGLFTAAGANVPILTGTPTANIAGATFFVGYGTSGTSMINSGINRGAVSIPGSVQCNPGSPQTGWWWNPAEGGRGYSLEVQGRNMFFASFLYDVSGRSTWYVSTGPVSLDGSLYAGDLLSARGGQTLGGPYPGFPSLTTVGQVLLTFNTASQGTMVWPGGTVPIERFNIVPNGLTLSPVAGQPENGWWWNESESGRGFFLEWQGGTLDIAGYMYDEQGNPVWYLTENDKPSTNLRSFSGNWWSFGNGQTLTGAYKPATQLSNNVAPVTIQFSGPDTALMTLPNGRTTNLKRQRF